MTSAREGLVVGARRPITTLVAAGSYATLALGLEVAGRWWAGHTSSSAHLVEIVALVGVTSVLLHNLLRRRDRTIQGQEDRLSASDERVQALSDSAQNYTMVLDEAGVIDVANPTAELVLGVLPGGSVGRSLTDFVHPDDRAAVGLALRRASERRADAGVSVTFRLTSSQGSGGGRFAVGDERWVKAAIAGNLDDATIGGLVLRGEDVTHLQQNERFVTTLLDSAMAITRAVTMQAVAGAVLDASMMALGSTGGSLYAVLDERPGCDDGPSCDEGPGCDARRTGGGELVALAGTGASNVASLRPLPLHGPSPQARAVRSRQLLVAVTPPDAPDAPEDGGVICVPMLVGDRCVGLISLSVELVQPLGSTERSMLWAFAHQGAVALERARAVAAQDAALAELSRAAERAAEHLASYEALFRNHPQPMLVCADDGLDILAGNDAVLAELGYRSEELSTMRVTDVLACGEGSRIVGILRGEGFDHRTLQHIGLVRLRRKDGSTFVADASGNDAASFTGRSARVVVFSDQTARVQAEADRLHLQERLLGVAEEERRRLAEILHDGPVQDLAVVAMRLSALRRAAAAAGSPDALVAGLAHNERSVIETIDQLRGVMMHLYPTALDEMSLAEAIAGAVAESPSLATLSVRVEDHLDRPVAPAAKAVLYRVVLEALQNVRKHARTDAAVVELREDGDVIDVRVCDHGVGIEDPQRLRPRHLGLPSMRDRLAVLGGSLDVERISASGGTLVRARLPYRAVCPEPPEAASSPGSVGAVRKRYGVTTVSEGTL